MTVKRKKRGFGLEIKTFTGKSGTTYIVFRKQRSFHVFSEVEAKKAAEDCGEREGTTQQRWRRLWNKCSE